MKSKLPLIFFCILVLPLVAHAQISSKNFTANTPDSSYYDSERSKSKVPSNIDTEFQRHLESQNQLNYDQYLRSRTKVRRSHIKYMVNRKPFVAGADTFPEGKTASMAVEARYVDGHDENVDRFTRECIRYIKESLGNSFVFHRVSYLTKRTQDPRDPASFSVDLVTGLCEAVPNK